MTALARLEGVFAHCFASSENARLVGGAAEPLYEPATSSGGCNILHYRDDYFASALHEVAHWCIAGPARRRQRDFGYWYAPDGRSPGQQRAFEQVEYKPQALEWYFARACGSPFRLSLDNLQGSSGQLPDNSDFALRVVAQARHWQQVGLPSRGELFFGALSREFGTGATVNALCFEPEELTG